MCFRNKLHWFTLILGNGQNLENMKAISAPILKIEKILISVVKILWGGGKCFFFFGGL